MTPKEGQFHYEHRDRHYIIYRYVRVEEGFTQSSPVRGEHAYTDSESARKRVYELNGWNYTPK